jgi:hypothetical protein
LGRGNAKIIGFSSEREGKVTLQNALFTNEVIAMMSGNPISSGVANIYQRDVLTVNSNSATLQYTPSNGTGALISVYKLNADGTHGTELTYASGTVATGQYSRSTKTLTFFAGDIANGGQVVAYYNTNTDATANKITISSDKFAGTFKLVLDCLVRDAVTKNDYAAQITINNAKMEDNWKIDMAGTGDPSVFDIPMEILKPVNATEMWTMTVYDQGLLT